MPAQYDIGNEYVLFIADLAGLDTLLFISNALYEEFKEPQYAPPTLTKKWLHSACLGGRAEKAFTITQKSNID